MFAILGTHLWPLSVHLCFFCMYADPPGHSERITVHIFLPVNLNMCFGCSKTVLGAQKNRLIETILLSTCNIHFG